jgi:hypothetical protein
MLVRALALVALALVSSPAFAQSEQPAYHEYVRSLQNDKNVRSGRSTIFTYAQWVQYCRGEFRGPVVRSRWRRDTTCRNFVNPPVVLPTISNVATATSPADALPANWNFMDAQEQAWWMCREDPERVTARCKNVTKQGERASPAASAQTSSPSLPSNWNFMGAGEQARWLCRNKNDRAACERADDAAASAQNTHITKCFGDAGCTSVPNPNYRPAAPTQWDFTGIPAAPRCGRRCGEVWTDADFAEAEREIARLQREIERLSQPIYTPPPPRSPYAPYVPPAPVYVPQPIYTPRSQTTYVGGDVNGTVTDLGRYRYYNFSNGVSGTSTTIGRYQFHNFYGDNGSSLIGTTSNIGRYQFHNFDNGVNGTTTQIGRYKYSNFSDGTSCTTTKIGTTEYTNCH